MTSSYCWNCVLNSLIWKNNLFLPQLGYDYSDWFTLEKDVFQLRFTDLTSKEDRGEKEMAQKSLSVNKGIKGQGKRGTRTVKTTGSRQQAGQENMVSRVRELAWEGKHAQAIELTTQALSQPNLKPAEPVKSPNPRAGWDPFYRGKSVMDTSGMWLSVWEREEKANKHYVSTREDPAWAPFVIAARAHVKRLRNYRELI